MLVWYKESAEFFIFVLSSALKSENETSFFSVADPECLSQIRLFSIPDPNWLHPGSSSKNLSILTLKKFKKWFLSSKKYDPGCSSRIRMLTFSHPGSRGQKGTQSRIRIRNTGFLIYLKDLLIHKYWSGRIKKLFTLRNPPWPGHCWCYLFTSYLIY